MEVQEIERQFNRLPPAAQQAVAQLMEFLSRPPDAVNSWADAIAAGRPTEAVLLPPLDTDEMPITWPENRYMDPYYFGAWANRTDVGDSTEFVRALRHEQNRAA